MATRIYLHFEGPPQYSKLFKLPVDSLVEPSELLQRFSDAFSKKFPESSLRTADLAIKPIGGKELQSAFRVTESLDSDYTVFFGADTAR